VVEVGRITLAPGASLPPHEVAGMEIISVERGPISLSHDGAERDYGSGEGTFAVHGERMAIRNSGPDALTLLVVVLHPAGATRVEPMA
jgi:quercetin dioxygenase-like cupin family protein